MPAIVLEKAGSCKSL